MKQSFNRRKEKTKKCCVVLNFSLAEILISKEIFNLLFINNSRNYSSFVLKMTFNFFVFF